MLATFSERMNNYCYPEDHYIQGDQTRLRITVAFENGMFNDGLHAHALMMQKFFECNKSYEDIELFIRKTWYELLEVKGSIFGNLVDVQPVGDLEARIRYLCKNCWYLNKDFNLMYY